MEEETQWLNCLDKYVFEDCKIVTYKWLSRCLNIHVNISKRLLSAFVEKSDEELGVCYFIGGVMPDGSHRMLVGSHKSISDIKLLFKTVTSEHVYSVQKTASSEDLKVALYAADSFAVHDETKTGVSAISCPDSVKRPVTDLKRNALLSQKNKSEESIKRNGLEGKKQNGGSEKENIPKVNAVNDKSDFSSVKKSESSSPKKTGIAAAFANQRESKKVDNKEKVQKPSPKGKPKGLAAFFNQSKENNKKSEKSNDKDQTVKSNSENNQEKSNLIVTNESKERNNVSKVEEKPETILQVSDSYNDSVKKTSDKPSKSKVSRKTGKKRKKNKEDDSQMKKRKRIVVMSDSESSDEELNERSPSPVEREPTPPPPLSDDEDIVPATPQTGKKAKKKKLVEKTFLDEDGFLVTNKEYIFATSSEDEGTNTSENKQNVIENVKPVMEDKKSSESRPEKPKAKGPETKKKISPQKVKQSSIMNFFGKK